MKENKVIKDLRVDNKNHKLLWDKTDHQLRYTYQLETDSSASKCPDHIQYFPAHRCLQSFPNNLVYKNNSVKKGLKKKLRALRQLTPMYHVECLSSLLMVWGRVPSCFLLSILLARRPNVATREVFKQQLTGDTEAFLLCCACGLQSNRWTCHCWLPRCNHTNSHFLTWCTLDVVHEPWDLTCSSVPSLALRGEKLIHLKKKKTH